MNWYINWGKRVFDLLLAIPIAIASAPIGAVTWLLVRMKLGKPAIFRQDRPGKDAKTFQMVKFRTMTDERDPDGALLPDSERLTPLGRFLRATSLDEIPELWNVLKGDMSLVGPRPLLIDYLPHYTQRESRRHLLRPGMTGLAQVTGRNHLPWDERLEIDVQYYESCSPGLDLRIIAKTITKVLKRSDVLVVPSVTQRRLDHERCH